VEDPELRAFTFHFRPGLSPRHRAEVMADVVGLPTSAWLAREQKRSALPAFRHGHRALVDALDAAVADTPLFITGNYLLGASLEDCVTRSVQEHARWQRQAACGALTCRDVQENKPPEGAP
jgi:hypothetical protein